MPAPSKKGFNLFKVIPIIFLAFSNSFAQSTQPRAQTTSRTFNENNFKQKSLFISKINGQIVKGEKSMIVEQVFSPHFDALHETEDEKLSSILILSELAKLEKQTDISNTLLKRGFNTPSSQHKLSNQLYEAFFTPPPFNVENIKSLINACSQANEMLLLDPPLYITKDLTKAVRWNPFQLSLQLNRLDIASMLVMPFNIPPIYQTIFQPQHLSHEKRLETLNLTAYKLKNLLLPHLEQSMNALIEAGHDLTLLEENEFLREALIIGSHIGGEDGTTTLTIRDNQVQLNVMKRNLDTNEDYLNRLQSFEKNIIAYLRTTGAYTPEGIAYNILSLLTELMISTHQEVHVLSNRAQAQHQSVSLMTLLGMVVSIAAPILLKRHCTKAKPPITIFFDHKDEKKAAKHKKKKSPRTIQNSFSTLKRNH